MDSYIQVAPDSNGKLLQTYENNISGKTVEAEAVVLVDVNGSPIGTGSGYLNIALRQSTAAANISGGQVLVGGTATTIAAARSTRRSVTIRNTDSVNSGYIGPSNVNTSNGLLLFPRDSISVDYIGIIQGITGGNNVTFGYLETYD